MTGAERTLGRVVDHDEGRGPLRTEQEGLVGHCLLPERDKAIAGLEQSRVMTFILLGSF